MKNVIYTPFGNFNVKQNGQPIEFNYTIKNYSSNKSSTLIRLYVIEVDAKEKDSLVCGFEEPIFEKLNKDEYSTTLFVENDTLVLGLCSINPNKQIYMKTTNDEYGFTYQEENKIMLILCCIEKDKFKDAKKVIEKAIKNEIETIMNIKIKKKKSAKPFIVVSLFLLLSFLYIAFALLFIKYKIVSDETLKRIGIGLVGVMLISISLANLSTPKKRIKQKKTKTTFLITFLLLTMILGTLGTTVYFILCSIGIVKHEFVLALGLIIIALVILCWFTLEYKIEKPILNKEIKKEEENENSNIIEKPKQINPAVLNLSLMFPKKQKEDFFHLVTKLSIETIKVSELVETYQLTRETVEIPYRIELEELETDNLTEIEKQMLFCIYTRHYDGHIREKYTKKLLEMEIQEWEFPFLLKLSEEYIYEILELIYNALKGQNNQQLKEFAKNNKELLCKGYSKMTQYWNRFYREKTNFPNYVGRKLFRECFGYSRKYEKKRYQCACCKNKTVEGYLIHYYNEPCPVCYWQNNSIQNSNPKIDGINKITLEKAIENYHKIGAIKEEYVSLVRKPTEKEKVKINLEQIFKLLRVTLVKEGFNRDKKGIYEYKKQHFKITSFEDYITIDTARSKNDVEKNLWKTIEKLKIELDNKELVEKIVAIIKQSCEKKKTKKLTKVEKDKIVEEEINRWNPLGLIKNQEANGEYQLEIKKITTKLSKLKTETELKEHIEQVFQKLFGENLFTNKKNEIELVAETIWKRINQK